MNDILIGIIITMGMITFIIEMVTIYKVEEKGNVLAWNIFLATCLGYYITSATAGISGYLYYDKGLFGHSTSFNEALRPIGSIIGLFIIPTILNSIVLVVGVRTKDNIRDPKIKLNIIFTGIFLITILINVVLFLSLHLIVGK